MCSEIEDHPRYVGAALRSPASHPWEAGAPPRHGGACGVRIECPPVGSRSARHATLPAWGMSLLRLRSRDAEEAAREAADQGERGLHFPAPQRVDANRNSRRLA